MFEVIKVKLSTRSRYGLKAIVDIAAQKPFATSIKSIAARQDIPVNYLEQIIFLLRKSGFVKSIRGAQGGYILNCDLNSTTVGDILRTLEGSLYPVKCLAHSKKELSSREACENCFTRSVWQKIYENINAAVDSVTIADLLDDYRKVYVAGGNDA